MIFQNREEAARRLSEALTHRAIRDPLVLAIPRGGVVPGSFLAKILPAEMNLVLARKLRAPGHPECAIGAVSETGLLYLTPVGERYRELTPEYVELESCYQTQELTRRNRLFREVLPPAKMEDRSVIVVDDGLATGATMIAALQEIHRQYPHEVIVALPVGSPESLDLIRGWCDEIICLHTPQDFVAVGDYYRDFAPVTDDKVVSLLRDSIHNPPLESDNQHETSIAIPN